MENRLTMGKHFNSHFGYVELPSEIIEVGIFDTHLEFDCIDGIYHVTKRHVPEEGLLVKKVYDKKTNKDEL